MAEITRWKQIGERVGRLILSKGYRSVELFAHEHGIHKSVLSRLINGKREIRISTFLKIAEALETGLDELALPLRSNPTLPNPRTKEKGLLKIPALQNRNALKSSQKKSFIEDRVARLDLSELDCIELHRNRKDKNPVILGVQKRSGEKAR